MTLDGARIERALKTIELKRSKLRKQLQILNAQHRVWADRHRNILRKAARAKLAKLSGRSKAAKQLTPLKETRGRKARWPGLCNACCRRHFNKPGGPKHETDKCKKTQKWLHS